MNINCVIDYVIINNFMSLLILIVLLKMFNYQYCYVSVNINDVINYVIINIDMLLLILIMLLVMLLLILLC